MGSSAPASLAEQNIDILPVAARFIAGSSHTSFEHIYHPKHRDIVNLAVVGSWEAFK